MSNEFLFVYPLYSSVSYLLITLSPFVEQMRLWVSGSHAEHELHEQAPQNLHTYTMMANALAAWGEGRGKYKFLSI